MTGHLFNRLLDAKPITLPTGLKVYKSLHLKTPEMQLLLGVGALWQPGPHRRQQDPSGLEKEHHAVHTIWIEGPPQQEGDYLNLGPPSHTQIITTLYQVYGLSVLSILTRHLCLCILSQWQRSVFSLGLPLWLGGDIGQ